MKRGFKKFVSMILSMAMTITYVMPSFVVPTVMADSQSDMEYAISMMNKYAVIVNGDFTNGSHTMAPIACKGDYDGNMFYYDKNFGFLGEFSFSLSELKFMFNIFLKAVLSPCDKNLSNLLTMKNNIITIMMIYYLKHKNNYWH